MAAWSGDLKSGFWITIGVIGAFMVIAFIFKALS